MAFKRFGKLDAALVLLTQRPAGLRNLLKEVCRTKSLLGERLFAVINRLNRFWDQAKWGKDLMSSGIN
jgi:hypothetical protein